MKIKMIRLCFCFVFLICVFVSTPAQKTTIYLFPGLGSDERIFQKLQFDTNYTVRSITYSIPPKNCTMQKYAEILLPQIDTNNLFIFVGVSIGGMICTELSELTKPVKVIIISSAKCRKELPFRYRFQSFIPLNKIIPKGLYKQGAKMLQPIVEPDRNKNKSTFKSMLEAKNSLYLKRSVHMIINWKRKEFEANIQHIHGTKDHTLPFRKIKANYIVKNGSHMMTLTKGEEMNTILQSILSSN